MKRKTLDKKIIKALAIGMSASMALQPVTAFAEVGEEEGSENGQESASVGTVSQENAEVTASDVQDASNTFSTEAGKAADEVQDVEDLLKSDETAGKEAVTDTDFKYDDLSTSDGTKSDLVGNTLNSAITDNTENLSKNIHDVNDDAARSDDKDNDDKTKVAADVDAIVTDEKLLNQGIDVVDSTAESMKSIANGVDTTSQTIESSYEAAQGLVDKASSDEGTAEDVAAADKAVEDLGNAVVAAQAALETAQTDYTNLETQYNQALDAVAAAQAAYDAAILSATNDAAAEMEKLNAALQSAEALKNAADKAASDVQAKKTAYETACANAKTGAQDAVAQANEALENIQEKISNINTSEETVKSGVTEIGNKWYDAATKGIEVAVPVEGDAVVPVEESGDSNAPAVKIDPITATNSAYKDITGYADDMAGELENAETDFKNARSALEEAIAGGDEEAISRAQDDYNKALSAKEAAEAKKSMADNAVNEANVVKNAADEYGTANGALQEVISTQSSLAETAKAGKDAIGDATDVVWKTVLGDIESKIDTTKISGTVSDTQEYLNADEFIYVIANQHIANVEGKKETAVDAVLAVNDAIIAYIDNEKTKAEDKLTATNLLSDMETIIALANVYKAAAEGETNINEKTAELKTVAQGALNSIGNEADITVSNWFASFKKTEETAQDEKTTAELVKEAARNVVVKNAEATAAVAVKKLTDGLYTDLKALVEAGKMDPVTASNTAYATVKDYVDDKDTALTKAADEVTAKEILLNAAIETGNEEVIEAAQLAYDDAVTKVAIAQAEKDIAENALKEAGKLKTLAGVFKVAQDVLDTATAARDSIISVVVGYKENKEADNNPVGDAADILWKEAYAWFENEVEQTLKADAVSGTVSEKATVLTQLAAEVTPVKNLGVNGQLDPVVAVETVKGILNEYLSKDVDADTKAVLDMLNAKVTAVSYVSDVYALGNVNNANTSLYTKYNNLVANAGLALKNIGNYCDTMITQVLGWADKVVAATSKNASDAEKKEQRVTQLLEAEQERDIADQAQEDLNTEVTNNLTKLAQAQIAYSNLKNQADEAYNQVLSAKNKCQDLQNKIAKLTTANTANKADYSLMIENLEKELGLAKKKLSDAEDLYDEVVEALDDAKADLKEKKDALAKVDQPVDDDDQPVADDDDQPAPSGDAASSDDAPASTPAASDAPAASSSTVAVTTAPIASNVTTPVTGENLVNNADAAPAVNGNNAQAPAANNGQAANNAAGNDAAAADANIPDGPVATTDAPAVDANIPDAPSATADAPEVTATITDGPSATAAAPETENKGIPGFLIAILGGAIAAAGVGVEEGVRRGKIKNIFKSGSKVTK